MDNGKAPEKKRFFNLFDVVIIGVVLLAAVVFLLWQRGGTAASIVTNTETVTVQYTIELVGLENGTEQLIQVGDNLLDNVKNCSMGEVLSVEISTTTRQAKNMETGETVLSEVPWQKTAVIVLETTCNESESALTTADGYVVRAGDTVSAKGPGYAGKGYILAVSRGEAQ